MKMRFNVGDKVIWKDPDDDILTGQYEVIEKYEDHYLLKNSADGFVESLDCEMEPF